MEKNWIPALSQALELNLKEPLSEEILKEELSRRINYLIQHDFQKLVSLLYRIDINEEKLKTVLKENPGIDAGKIMAEMIIERQLQKIKSRQQFRQSDHDSADEEKW